MTKLDAALALGARGFKVFPIKTGVKFPPLVKDWPARTTADASRENRSDKLSENITYFDLSGIPAPPGVHHHRREGATQSGHDWTSPAGSVDHRSSLP